MRGIVTGVIFWWSWLIAVFSLTAQELQASVAVNSTALQGRDRELFLSLEESLNRFLNGQQWGDQSSQTHKKVRCSFNLVITGTDPTGSFRGELYLQSFTRDESDKPLTPLLKLRDKELVFSYSAHQPLIYDARSTDDNLTAIVAYYACLILGLEGDVASPLGGTNYFRAMEQIATGARSHGWPGWESYRHQGGRTAIAEAFNDGSLEQYRLIWHRFHADPQITTATGILRFLSSLHRERPGHRLLALFGDARLQELTDILSQGSRSERTHYLQLLREIYPTRNDALDKLRE